MWYRKERNLGASGRERCTKCKDKERVTHILEKMDTLKLDMLVMNMKLQKPLTTIVNLMEEVQELNTRLAGRWMKPRHYLHRFFFLQEEIHALDVNLKEYNVASKQKGDG